VRMESMIPCGVVGRGLAHWRSGVRVYTLFGTRVLGG
jgi:hypothetical protein